MNNEKKGNGKTKKIVVGVATVVAVAAIAVPTALTLAGGKDDAVASNQNNRYNIIVSSGIENVPDYSISIEKGTSVSTLKTMLKAIDGYDITGIYRDEKLTQTYNDEDYITNDTKIFIKFEIKRFKLEICDENKQVIDNKTQIVEYGSEATLEKLDDKVSELGTYKFMGWADVETNELITDDGYDITMVDDLKVYPIYAEVEYTDYRISYSFGDGNDYRSSIEISVGGEAVSIDSTYHFGAKVKIKVTARENNEVTEFKVKVGASKVVDALTYSNRVVESDGTISYVIEVEGNGDIAITYNEHAKEFSLGEFANNITVKRNNKVLTSSDKIYYGDELEINYTPIYEDSERSLKVVGARPYGGYWIVENDVEISYTETRNKHSITIPEGVVVTRGEETLTNDSVIYYGDELHFTYTERVASLTGNTKQENGYNYSEEEITTYLAKVGDVQVYSGGSFIVQADSISISITSTTSFNWVQGERIKYSLGTIPEYVVVKRNGLKLSSNQDIYYGDNLEISYIEYEDFSNFSLLVNGEEFEKGSVLEVTGNVEISFSADYAYSYLGFEDYGNSCAVSSYDGTEANVVIPATYKGKKVIAVKNGTDSTNGVFANQPALKSVVLGENIKNLGAYAFYGCSSLTSIEIPSSVTNTGGHAFDSCSNLTSVIISDGITSIRDSAFKGCTSLTSIEIPSSVTIIEYSAFRGCSSLTSIEIPSSVTSIQGGAFQGCSSLTSIEIPSSVTIIEYSAFQGCSSLTSIEIPSSVTSIGSYAFEECSSLTEIIIPSSVTSIGNNAFYNCSGLTSITIPTSVTSIGSQAFSRCSSLKEIIIPSNVTSIGDGAFKGCSSLTSIEIPSSVTSIGNYAFDSCSGLTSVTIPSSVTSIQGGAFKGCSSLTSVIISDGVTSIGGYAFQGCTSLTTIEIPSSVTGIGIYAFSACSSLTSVIISDGVTSIGNYAFKGCTSLTSIEIPSSVTSIGVQAFYNCSSLTEIIIPSSVTSIGSNAFYNCSRLTSVTFENTTGWKAGTVVVNVTDPSQNATYLKTTYRSSTWTRS